MNTHTDAHSALVKPEIMGAWKRPLGNPLLVVRRLEPANGDGEIVQCHEEDARTPLRAPGSSLRGLAHLAPSDSGQF